MTTPATTIEDLERTERAVADKIMARLTQAMVGAALAILVSIVTAAYSVGHLSSRVDTAQSRIEKLTTDLEKQADDVKRFYSGPDGWVRVIAAERRVAANEGAIAELKAKLEKIDDKLEIIITNVKRIR